MKRKFWVVLLAIVAMLCMAFGLAACKDKGFGKKDPDDTGNNPPAVDPSGGEQGGNQGEPGGEQKPDDGEQEPGEEKHVHIMVEHQQEDATCTVEGKRAYWHCSGCNKDYLDQDGNEEAGDLTIPAVGHVLQKVEKKEPTCLEDGNVEYYHCSVCEKDYPENDKFSKDELNSTVLPATGHNFQEHERKEATCFENGNIAYYHCTNCNKDFDSSYEPVENVTIPATHFYFSEKENPEGYTVLGPVVTCKCAELEIPEEYEGHKVIGIDDYAFYGCDWVTSITIPNSVTSIGARAFYECSGLTSINIPDRVTSIGSEAFMDCSGLTSINIPDSVTAIGYAAFHGCSGLTSITIPDSVTAIGYAAFQFCSGLTSVTIPDSVTAIGEGAFYQCSGLTSVTIGNGVTSIGQAAFIDCSRLTSVTIPDSVTAIGYRAFSGCSGLTSVTIGSGVTAIGYGTFSSCKRLTSVNIPDGVTAIGESAFENCIGLTKITIGKGVTSIENMAFSFCYKLMEVWNYSKLNIEKGSYEYGDIGYYAKQVYKVDAESKQIKTSDGYLFYEDGSESYLLGYLGSSTELILPEKSPRGNQYEIYQYAFQYHHELTSVTISDCVTSMGNYALADCSGLIEIKVGKKNQTYHVKENCLIETNSKTLIAGCKTSKIPNDGSVTSIGEGAFKGCSGLTSITIPDSVTEIGASAFENCSGLTSITIPNTVTTIENHVFACCSGLTSITIPNSVRAIGGGAFFACDGIKGNLKIPDSVRTIGNEAFQGCGGLTSVTIGSGVRSISSYAFESCGGLTSVTIGSGVTEIGWHVFYLCNKLKEVYFKNPNGWEVKALEVFSDPNFQFQPVFGLKDPATAAQYLRDTYCEYHWKREG